MTDIRTKSDLVRRDLKHLIHPQHHPGDHQTPQVWVGGHGIRLKDIEGRFFIDGLSSMWNVYLGHNRKELRDAAYAQFEKLAFATAYAGSTNEAAVKLSEKLGQIAYPNINSFYYTLGGSDATDTSVRTVRFYWKALGLPKKNKIIARKLSYHGSGLGSSSITAVEEFSRDFGPKAPGILHIDSPYPYRFETARTDVSPGVAAANLLEDAILREGADTVAAFIAEPVQGGGGGVLIPQDDYFKRIREICDKHNVLFIADEVITGFGRTGKWFALEHWGIEPDILQFAKGITSGYFPLGGVGFSDKIKDVLDSVPSADRWWHGYTASAHPVGCALALENIRILEEECLVSNSERQGRRLLEKLSALSGHKNVGEIRGLGLLAAVELVADKASKKRFDAADNIGGRIKEALFRRGLISRMFNDTICLAPPLILKDAETDEIAQIVSDAVKDVLGDS